MTSHSKPLKPEPVVPEPVGHEPVGQEAGRPATSRRRFLGTIATASAAVGAATVSVKIPALADEKLEPVPASDLAGLHRWVAAGANWETMREHFLLDRSIVHLNTGSLGASPAAVVEAHARYLRDIEANPAHLLFGSMGAQMEAVRQQAADYLGASLGEVMLTANTTSGMNLVATALQLQAGDEVLTTNQEHAGGRVCWDSERSQSGVVLREFDLNAVRNETDILEAVKAGLTPRTKVISLSHVSTISGLRLPIAAISKLARERGIFVVVDGAQSAGMLDINLHQLGCDAFATSGHKWMLAPKGTGILYLRQESQPRLANVLLKSGFRSYTAASGTRNVPQILAQGVAIDFLNTVGRQRIEKRTLQLAALLRNQLQQIPGVEIVSPAVPALQSAIVTLKLPARGQGKPGSALTGGSVSHALLDTHKVVVKAVPGEHLQGRGIRLSTHFYNSPAEVKLLGQCLKDLIETS